MRHGWYALLTIPLLFVGVSSEDSRPGGHPERAIVRITAAGCSAVDTIATGWLDDGGFVITVAHAVRGSTSVRADGVQARVVLVDNQTDVAALVPVSSIDATALSLASSGDAPAVWLARLNGALGTGQLENTRAGAVLTTTIDEPVDDTTYTRRAFRVAAALEHGDSGAPVVDGSGRVTGMMFATSRDGSAAAYAVAADDIHRTLDEVRIDSPSVDTGRCN